jgi:hypothetical protein
MISSLAGVFLGANSIKARPMGHKTRMAARQTRHCERSL